MNYVFDVDGTLTPSSKEIDKEFEEFFLDFTTNNNVTIVGGSTYDMIKEQLGESICNGVDSVFIHLLAFFPAVSQKTRLLLL